MHTRADAARLEPLDELVAPNGSPCVSTTREEVPGMADVGDHVRNADARMRAEALAVARGNGLAARQKPAGAPAAPGRGRRRDRSCCT